MFKNYLFFYNYYIFLFRSTMPWELRFPWSTKLINIETQLVIFYGVLKLIGQLFRTKLYYDTSHDS